MRRWSSRLSVWTNWLRIPIRGYEPLKSLCVPSNRHVTNPYKGLWAVGGNISGHLIAGLRIPIRGYEPLLGIAIWACWVAALLFVTNPYKGLWVDRTHLACKLHPWLRIPIRGYEGYYVVVHLIPRYVTNPYKGLWDQLHPLALRTDYVTNPYKGLWGRSWVVTYRQSYCYESL